jgi:hypothetical protein
MLFNIILCFKIVVLINYLYRGGLISMSDTNNLKFTSDEINAQKLDELISSRKSFQIVAVKNISYIVNLIEGAIEKKSLSCRVYSEMRAAAMAGIVIPAIAAALPSEYVEKELKARIDRLVLATADSCKLEKLSFVMFGNSRYMHLLKDQIKWVVQAGDTYGGVRMTYSYGIMNSGDIRIQVVSSRKIDINNTYGDKLRLLPISMDPSILTWEMLKYDSYILNSPKEAGYLNNKLPGGAYSVVTASTRVKPIALQGFQSYVTLSNKADYVL